MSGKSYGMTTGKRIGNGVKSGILNLIMLIFSLSCILLRGGKLLKKSESVIEYNIELSVYAAKAAIYAPGGFYERQSGKHSFNADFKYDGYRHACL